MEMSNISVNQIFPTIIFEIFIDDSKALQILEEIKSKKNEIDSISGIFHEENTEEYSTDYFRPVHIESFDEVLVSLKERFLQEHALHFHVTHSWTSFYFKGGKHTRHGHKTGIFDHSTNYSGILYLTNIGGTKYFTDKSTVADSIFVSKSQFAKIVLFPSSLQHEYMPETESESSGRYVLPFNCFLTKEPTVSNA